MIQRIQTLYLTLAAICVASVYFFQIASAIQTIENISTNISLKVAEHIDLLVTLSFNVALIITTIFFYKNRKKQIWLSITSILCTILFLFFINLQIEKIKKLLLPTTPLTYSLAIVLPFAAIVFITLSIYYIRKDEQLIKSLNRLT
jgi:hypothetical protein